MPVYIYLCETCKKEIEVIQSIKDKSLETCSCGGSLRKKMLPVAISFKGPGFYVNDSKNK